MDESPCGSLRGGALSTIHAECMKPEHKRMSRMIGYCLTLGTPEAWAGFRFAALPLLTEVEKAMLAYFALTSFEPENIELLAGAAIRSSGHPLPPFLGGMEDARSWAAWASRFELKAYALAAFEAMSPADRAAFVQHISAIEVPA